MSENKLLLKVDNYKAIRSAKIELDDIAVIVGPNGSGKSTISHAFHSICNLSAMYPKYLVRYEWRRIEKLIEKIRDLGGSVLGSVENEFPAASQNLANAKSQPDFEAMLKGKSFQDVLSDVKNYVDKVLLGYQKGENADAMRAFGALRSLVDPEATCQSVDGVRDAILARIDDVGAEYDTYVNVREYAVYNEAATSIRKWLWASGEMHLLEGESPVYGTVKKVSGIDAVDDLKRLYGVEQALYITSPLVSTPEFEDKERIGFNDGFTFYAKENPSFSEKDLFSVMGGAVAATEDPDASKNESPWTYTRTDGLKVDLDMCATGLRSFAILQLLCRYSLLNEGTLLIVDEPEAHLHPKWIVEYAHTLVGLVQRLKIRLLIATHSPYFLNALEKFIPEEQIGAGVRFYEMREVDHEKGLFESRDVSSNLEPVYKSMYEPFVG